MDMFTPHTHTHTHTGRVQLMQTELDEKPILIDTGLRPSEEARVGNRLQIAWNSNGSVLAVGGVLDSNGQDKVGFLMCVCVYVCVCMCVCVCVLTLLLEFVYLFSLSSLPQN